ncbi:transglutaminase-like domain-containing protein [Terribacillus saccharophilus]|jgi:transglutaminase-like putative cysteine protease|uniref:Transglutaminase n=1 Tax=Terribacillus saccharophilus TaxID=361277 RepID=A0ABX4GYB5_9BACI|nr:transglutaminase family protein [Terribacillus saccharophilus]PAD35857.1 transglutaminase [Terribacillus saccharophilus]PAD96281.1 transglutaminase [Terribacillus saccharophilus]PAD99856.1 transglutaminase [Terribacillus saccharophilus]
MNLIPESQSYNDYLDESDVIDFSHPLIRDKISELISSRMSEIDKVRVVFHYVRDSIGHSWDIQSKRVTCRASEVLTYKEGICYAKSNLLAAMLRSLNIPTGFCYQRLTLFDTPDKGYCIHALNGVYIKSLNKWIRLDARGNKPGIQSEFSLHDEQLAFRINEQFDEIDYPIIYAKPNVKTIRVLESSKNALDMYKRHLPDFI